MKIKLFLSSSLTLLGLWLVAAYMHTVDMDSYNDSSAPSTASDENNADAIAEIEKEYEAVTSLK